MRPASDIADDIVSASNIVTCAGYYECDPVAVSAIIEADRKQVREETVREIVDWVGSLPDSDSDIWADEIERKFLGEKA